MSRPLPHSSILLLCCALCAPVFGQGRWEHLSSGMDEQQVSHVVGQPLIVHGGRGYVQWTFDAGALVMFHGGRVAYWGAPKGYKPTPRPLPTLITEPIPGHEPPTSAQTAPAPAATDPSTLARGMLPPAPTIQSGGDSGDSTIQVQVKARSFYDIVKS